jgi:hypothetical protein
MPCVCLSTFIHVVLSSILICVDRPIPVFDALVFLAPFCCLVLRWCAFARTCVRVCVCVCARRSPLRLLAGVWPAGVGLPAAGGLPAGCRRSSRRLLAAPAGCRRFSRRLPAVVLPAAGGFRRLPAVFPPAAGGGLACCWRPLLAPLLPPVSGFSGAPAASAAFPVLSCCFRGAWVGLPLPFVWSPLPLLPCPSSVTGFPLCALPRAFGVPVLLLGGLGSFLVCWRVVHAGMHHPVPSIMFTSHPFAVKGRAHSADLHLLLLGFLAVPCTYTV